MERDRISCYFGPFFALLSTPQLLNPENQNFEKMRKKPPKTKNKINKKPLGDIIILHHAPKIMIICYAVPEIWCETNLIFIFNLGYFFPFTPIMALKNQRFYKMKTNTRRYHHCTNVYQKLWSPCIWFLRYGVRQTDGWTDGKSDILRWVLHLK